MVDPDLGIELAQFANIENATIWGIELDLEAILANAWTAFGSVAYIEGDNNVTNEPLPTIPPLKVDPRCTLSANQLVERGEPSFPRSPDPASGRRSFLRDRELTVSLSTICVAAMTSTLASAC